MKKFLVLLAVMAIAVCGFAQNYIVNGDLEAWTAGAPDNWDVNSYDASFNLNPTTPFNYTVDQETVDLPAGTSGTSAMSITRTASDWTYRYSATSAEWTDQLATLTFTAQIKGNTTQRIYPAYTDDAGTTWAVQNATPIYQATGAGDHSTDSWEAVSVDETNAACAVFTVAHDAYKITLHSITAPGMLIDDISLTGTVAIDDWDLY